MSEFPKAIVAAMDESTKKLKVQSVLPQSAAGALTCSPKQLHHRGQHHDKIVVHKDMVRSIRV